MMGLLKKFFKLLIIAVLLFFAWQWAKGYITTSPSNPTKETPELTQKTVSSVDTLLVQQKAGSGDKRLIRCGDSCVAQSQPQDADGPVVSNGTDWFYYTTKENLKGEELTQLVTSTADSQPKNIAAQTDLIKPRGLFLSPAGNKLAYFLDNIHEPEKKLTEVWLYDNDSGAVSVLAEKLHVPDMMTRLRWNSAGTRLWFVANSGTQEKPVIEFVVLNADSNTPRASFTKLDWESLKDTADKGTMDIDGRGEYLAYGKSISPGFDKLVITNPNGQQFSAAMPGTIPYIEWLPGGGLTYAVQDNVGFGFWITRDGKANLMAYQRGVLRSARTDGTGEHIVFAADIGASSPSLFVLGMKSKYIVEQEKIPGFGDYVFVVQAKPGKANTSQVAGITSELSDEEIAAFIDKNIIDITRDLKAKKSKLITTSEANTVLLDYRDKDGNMKRLTVTIRDAIHPEWSIRARYQDSSGTWQKVEGGGLLDPKPLRLYEWEDTVNQWILKEEYR